MIEQTFLSHALGTVTHTGYPASMLCEHIPLSQVDEDDAVVIQGFYDTFPEHPRARFGGVNEINIPSISQIDPEWLGARVSELREDLKEQDTHLRFMTLDGADRRAAAIAWIGGEGCIIMSEFPADFDELELRLGVLRDRL